MRGRSHSLTEQYLMDALIDANPENMVFSRPEALAGFPSFFIELHEQLRQAVSTFYQNEKTEPLEAAKALQLRLNNIAAEFLDPRNPQYSRLDQDLRQKAISIIANFEEKAGELRQELESKQPKKAAQAQVSISHSIQAVPQAVSQKPGIVSRFFTAIGNAISSFFSTIGRFFSAKTPESLPILAAERRGPYLARPNFTQQAVANHHTSSQPVPIGRGPARQSVQHSEERGRSATLIFGISLPGSQPKDKDHGPSPS